MESELGSTKIYRTVKWNIWEEGRSENGFHWKPVGKWCSLRSLLEPGVYCKSNGGYLRIAESTAYTYITHLAYHQNGRKWRLYATTYPKELRHLGIALVYVDNVKTHFSPILHSRGKKGEGQVVKTPEKYLARWSQSTIADMWSSRVNKYDTGYPAGPPLRDVDVVADLKTPALTEVDPLIYDNFRDNMHSLFEEAPVFMARCGKTRKIGVAAVAETIPAIVYRNSYPWSPEHLEAAEALSKGVIGVGVLPKVGSLTSTGKVRKVFPMSPALQYALETLVGKRTLVIKNATVVYGARFPAHKYTLDVVECDRKVFPYLKRYVGEYLPHLMDIFLPPVFTSDGVLPPNQFFSGLYGTNHVTTCFAAAVARTLTTDHFHVQGDGIMFEHPPCAYFPAMDLLRWEKPYTINGFCYSDGSPRYVNATLRLTSPRLVNPRSLSGDLGWAFRREIYKRFLHPVELPENHTEHDLSGFTNRELIDLCISHHICVRKLRYTGAIADSPRTPWHICETEPIPVCHTTPLPRIYCHGFAPIRTKDMPTYAILTGNSALPPRSQCVY